MILNVQHMKKKDISHISIIWLNNIVDQEKTLCHYVNSENVAKDTFEYVMKIIEYQCNKYLEGK